MNGDSLLAGLTRFDATEVEETIGLESVISPTTSTLTSRHRGASPRQGRSPATRLGLTRERDNQWRRSQN